MKIIAVDQSLTKTGIIVFNNEKIEHFEIFKTSTNHDPYQRSWDIATRISDLASIHKPNKIAIEGLAFNTQGNATRDLAGLQFTIITKLRFVDHISVTIIPPTTIKKIATGKGNSKKGMLFKCLPDGIKNLFQNAGFKKTTGLLDLTDAYWCGISCNKLY